MKRNRTLGKIFTIIIIAALLVGFAYLFLNKTDLMTGSIDNIQQITISSGYENTINSNEPLTLNDYEIQEIVGILDKSKYKKVVKRPDHLERMQSDSPYNINIAYADGTHDFLYFTENKLYVYRFLKTKGHSGDSGYITMKNTELYTYVSNLMNK